MKQENNTKAALVAVAHRLFAERGYYGVSIADIAGEIGITKQALLHHFGSKEALYGIVLEALSVRFESIVNAHLDKPGSPVDRFRLIMRDLYQHMNSEKHDAKLIMRELLDNQPRIEGKQKWYLRPFLETLGDLIQQISAGATLSKTEALTRTFQILGAVNYFAISDPTLKKMFGQEVYSEIDGIFLAQLEQLFGPG